MRILYYNHTGKVSGAERVLFMTLSGLDKTKLNPVLLAPESELICRFCRDQAIDHLPVRELRARFTVHPYRLLAYIASLVGLVQDARSAIKREAPDLIHANSTRAGIVMSLASLGLRVPVIWHIHDIFPRHPLSTIIRALAFVSKKNHLIGVSRATTESFCGKLPRWLLGRASVSVIHNGVDPAGFVNPVGDIRSLRESLGISPDHFTIGIIGQITPRKGHLGLLRAFSKLVESGLSNARLLIVGAPVFNNDVEYLKLLKAETRRLGLTSHVLFLGPRSNVPAILQVCKLLVLNSSVEPFGLVLVEAMLSGVPVVASLVGGVPEIIEDGKSGKLFHSGDEAGLAQALRELAENPEQRNRLAAQGRERALRNFTSSLFLRKLEQLYASIHFGSPNVALSSASRLQTEP